jgi:DNA (cytosine-5)-methyltransferase 1
MPHYPFRFVKAEALEYLAAHGREYDVIAASPPCQRYSRLFNTMEQRRLEHPDLVPQTRQLLERIGRPWLIENVYGAPLSRGSIMLCGAMFGLRTYRHRWFETSFWMFQPPHPRHRIKSNRGSRKKEYFLAGGFISVVGNVGSYCGPLAMGIDWMTGAELTQAIPPAYTEFLGRQIWNILS